MVSQLTFSSTDRPGPVAGMLLFFFACTLLTSVCLLGETLWRLHLSVACVFTLLLYGAWRISAGRSPTGFTLDDSLEAIVTRSGRTVPYATIRTVQLCQAPDLLTVRLVSGARFRGPVVLNSCDTAEAQRLAAALEQRNLHVAFKRMRLRQRTQEWLLLMVMPLTILIMLGFTVDLYQKAPHLKVRAKERVSSAAPVSAENEYTLAGSVFFLPSEFVIAQTMPDRMTFRDLSTQTALSISAVPLVDMSSQPRLAGPLLLYAGLQDDCAWLALALNNRVGLVPLIFKSFLLGSFEPGRVEVYRIKSGPFWGFLLRGPLRHGSGAGFRSEIFLTDRAGGRFIRFMMSGSRSADDRLLDRIIAGVG